MAHSTSSFESKTAEQWKELVTSSLRGKDWSSLTTTTPELITIEPLYTELTKEQEEQIQKLQQVWVTEDVKAIEPGTQVELDTRKWHKHGADAVTELVAFLLEAHKRAESGSIPEKVAFSVDTQFFMEIAKLRAARVLWSAFLHARNLETTSLVIVAETSLRSFSLYDPMVNLLRSANSAFSAVLGGANEVAVYPFDTLTGETELSKRLAANILEIIEHETFVSAVQDPAAGAYAIEALTDQLTEKAWNAFIEVSEKTEEQQNEWLQQQSSTSFDAQLQAVAKRKQALIGTTIYANPADPVTIASQDNGYKRLAEPFEELRASLQSFSEKVAIVQAGDYKTSKPRVDFCKGVLSTFGWDAAVISPAQMNEYAYIVIAGTDEDISKVVAEMTDGPQLVDIAGKHPEFENFQSKGVTGMIHLGQSLLEKGSELRSKLAVKEDAR